MKELYIHIGHYKTGTSAIQKYCSDHAEDLAKHGVFYPPTSRPSNNPTNHGDLSLMLAAKHGFTPPLWYGAEKKDIEEVYRAFFKSAQSAKQGKILVSSEEFLQLALRDNSEIAIEELRARVSAFDVKILFYVREPMALLKSWYNEVNKGSHGTRNFIVFFRMLNINFLAQYFVYQKFADVFGADKIMVHTYKDTGSAHIQSFFQGIGCDLVPSEKGNKTINKAQDLSVLELARLAKRRDHDLEEATLSEFKSLKGLGRKIDTINEAFAQVSSVADVAHESQLSLYNIFSHLKDLIEPLIPHKCINPKEAEVLRDAALEAEKFDLELAKLLMGMAKMIRPNGPYILRKLEEYEERLSLGNP